MIILNGKSQSVVVFGELSVKDFQEFINHVGNAKHKWISEGKPQSLG